MLYSYARYVDVFEEIIGTCGGSSFIRFLFRGMQIGFWRPNFFEVFGAFHSEIGLEGSMLENGAHRR